MEELPDYYGPPPPTLKLCSCRMCFEPACYSPLPVPSSQSDWCRLCDRLPFDCDVFVGGSRRTACKTSPPLSVVLETVSTLH